MNRITRRLLAISGIVALVLLLEGCSASTGISTSVGIHRSSSGQWGHSINVGIHNHGHRW